MMTKELWHQLTPGSVFKFDDKLYLRVGGNRAAISLDDFMPVSFHDDVKVEVLFERLSLPTDAFDGIKQIIYSQDGDIKFVGGLPTDAEKLRLVNLWFVQERDNHGQILFYTEIINDG